MINLTHEAKGLDTYDKTREKLEKSGDFISRDILERNYKEEVLFSFSKNSLIYSTAMYDFSDSPCCHGREMVQVAVFNERCRCGGNVPLFVEDVFQG